MRVITARDANQGFSRLLREVEAGEEFVITRNGRRIATLRPVADVTTSAEREAALRELSELMRQGLPLGGRRFTRDEMQRFELPPDT